MSNFVWAMVVLYGIDVIWRLTQLGTGVIHQHTRGTMALDTLINAAVFAWAVSILSKG